MDGGGPTREYLSSVCLELVSSLKLFIKSPNFASNVGEERESYVPNPSANSKTDRDNFYMVGMLIGLALRLGQCLELSFPSIFWSYLVGQPVRWNDLRRVNLNLVECIEHIERMADEDLDALEESFVTYQLDSRELELVLGGAGVRLTRANRPEYLARVKHTHLAALNAAFLPIREGFASLVPDPLLRGVTGDALERKVCGMTFVTASHSGRPGLPAQHHRSDQQRPREQSRGLVLGSPGRVLAGTALLVPAVRLGQVAARLQRDRHAQNRGFPVRNLRQNPRNPHLLLHD